MAGDWDADDLAAAAHRLRPRRRPRIVRRGCSGCADLHGARHPRRRARTPWTASRHNIDHHYDLSNDLFALFLDETLTYSSALFEERPTAPRRRRRRTSRGAQHRKIDRLLDLAGVGPGTRLLEIGTGWGELAAPRGRGAGRDRAHDHALAASSATSPLRRIAAAGVADRVDVELCDYRERAPAAYDAVVSVEMIEAVGDELLADLLRAPSTGCSRPGGRVGAPGDHDAARPDARHPRHVHLDQQVHLPRRLIPSVRAIEDTSPAPHQAAAAGAARRSGATTPRRCACGASGSPSGAGEVAALGFDDTFRRMWHFYLAYSEAGFASGYLDVHQLCPGPRTHDTRPIGRRGTRSRRPVGRAASPERSRRRPPGPAAGLGRHRGRAAGRAVW